MAPPAILYKYLSPARVDVLENLKIRFTQVSALNDPFESLPGATLEHSSWYKTYFQRKISDEIARLGLQGRSKRREYERRRWKDFGHFVKCYTDKKWLFDLSMDVQRMGDKVQACLSLSANSTNILMWSHYSVNHTGFVIGFDSKHEFFNNSVDPVIYSNKRPPINPFEARHDGDLFYTKSLDWSYEEEYRKFIQLITPQPLRNGNSFLPFDINTPQTNPNQTIKLEPLPPSSIRCVIFGWKASASLKDQVRAALHSHGIANVSILQAIPSLSEYKMDLEVECPRHPSGGTPSEH